MIKLMKTFELNGRRSQSVRDPESLHTRKIQFKGTEKLLLFFGVDKESARRKRHFTCMVGLKIVVVEGLSLLRVKHIIVTKNDVVRF